MNQYSGGPFWRASWAFRQYAVRGLCFRNHSMPRYLDVVAVGDQIIERGVLERLQFAD